VFSAVHALTLRSRGTYQDGEIGEKDDDDEADCNQTGNKEGVSEETEGDQKADKEDIAKETDRREGIGGEDYS
jgi:hypothetical protein